MNEQQIVNKQTAKFGCFMNSFECGNDAKKKKNTMIANQSDVI